MPLPSDPLQAWPPKHLEPVFSKINEWGIWYAGQPDKLADFYSRSRPAFPEVQPGPKDTAARWFWGEHVPDGQRRAKLHVPLAADIAQTSARLLFSEPPTLTATDKDTQARLDELIDDGAHAEFLAAAEVAAAKSGTYLRIVWDKTLRPRPWIARVDPGTAVPEFRWGVLTAVTFWRILERNSQRVVRYLERHEPGVIWHGVYDGTLDQLGDPVDVGGWADTSWLTSMEGVSWTGKAAAITTVPGRLTAAYIPNVTPTRIWADIPGAGDLGRSDYDSTEGLLDSLDETWSSLMRDLRLGVARVFVPQQYLTSHGPGKGATWEAAREILVGLETLSGDDQAMQMHTFQPDIRVEQHLRIADQMTRTIVETAGYSAQTFGMSDGTAVTATEVGARKQESDIGRDSKIIHWRPELGTLIETLLIVDATIFGTGVTPEVPQIDFGDTVSVDPEKQARTLQLLEAAQSISTWMKVKTLHPDWEDTEVRKEVDRIQQAGGAGEDPEIVIGGLNGGRTGGDPGQPPDPPADPPQE
ncbi:putative phage minor capsid protein [Actinoplanes missouriensis 431]|uniref:Putative phage minor capsid protein n=1 Tax=Actinoplanes missouriensis (strain ATCC 14538 / DSM 43046 / CBS 188.64 / JCM 3121 / NBRC 102363 / NCIMB 12654 / NRRL B-3342 / UNCC 431) TaxID=512565 RepID=I0GXI7_ACTM4|nr:phage portal protein [Actinoplanes missouriensis]KOX45267.1 phage minor capsid protein [Streptomyces purpurogeneiscleroticus]BAL85474.1 putative phage minor capsid protein [Actinoplanes missouriensis 431]